VEFPWRGGGLLGKRKISKKDEALQTGCRALIVCTETLGFLWSTGWKWIKAECKMAAQ
jgi:hypothetical protein